MGTVGGRWIARDIPRCDGRRSRRSPIEGWPLVEITAGRHFHNLYPTQALYYAVMPHRIFMPPPPENASGPDYERCAQECIRLASLPGVSDEDCKELLDIAQD